MWTEWHDTWVWQHLSTGTAPAYPRVARHATTRPWEAPPDADCPAPALVYARSTQSQSDFDLLVKYISDLKPEERILVGSGVCVCGCFARGCANVGGVFRSSVLLPDHKRSANERLSPRRPLEGARRGIEGQERWCGGRLVGLQAALALLQDVG